MTVVVLAVGASAIATAVTAGGAAPIIGAIGSAIVSGGGGTAAAAAGAAGATAAAGTGTAAATGAGVAVAATGPIGWAILGTSMMIPEPSCVEVPVYSFDCWKPILHDESVETSNGRFLVEILNDDRVKKFSVYENGLDSTVTLENIWNEKFQINFFHLHDGTLSAHAQMI